MGGGGVTPTLPRARHDDPPPLSLPLKNPSRDERGAAAGLTRSFSSSCRIRCPATKLALITLRPGGILQLESPGKARQGKARLGRPGRIDSLSRNPPPPRARESCLNQPIASRRWASPLLLLQAPDNSVGKVTAGLGLVAYA